MDIELNKSKEHSHNCGCVEHSHNHGCEGHSCGCGGDSHKHSCGCVEHSHNHGCEEHSHGCGEHSHNHGCGCGCEHNRGNGKIFIARIIVSIICFILGLIFKSDKMLYYIFFFVSYITAAYDILWQSFKNILKGKVFDENFLMSIASIGAWVVGEAPEAAAVIIFYQVGEMFQDMAVEKSRKSISDIIDIREEFAFVKKDSGKSEKVEIEKVEVGDIITVKAGGRIPLDGVIVKGNSTLDMSALTGESYPVDVGENDEILSGSVNLSGVIEIKITKPFKESTVARILEMVEYAAEKKSKSEKFITSFAKKYTPIVVILALITAIVPPVILNQNFSVWVYRALIFLVVSCPCALVISVPLGFFCGIGRQSKAGILIKGSNYLENLSKVSAVIFDKTGTLTKGSFEISGIYPTDKYSEKELIETAAYAEFYSDHPIAKSIVKYYNKAISEEKIKGYTELAGKGVSAEIDGKKVYVGNSGFIGCNDEISNYGTKVYIKIGDEYMGCIELADQIKNDSGEAIASLTKKGIKTAMLTGDSEKAADFVSDKLGIDEVYSSLLPDEKVSTLEKIMEKNTVVAFVGDGINDAPVIARSDIGIAMGALGADSAVEAADVVIMHDEPSKIVTAVDISKYTMRIIRQNIVFAISIKVIIMLLSVLGYSSMWLAIFADTGVAFLAVMNSLRIFFKKGI